MVIHESREHWSSTNNDDSTVSPPSVGRRTVALLNFFNLYCKKRQVTEITARGFLISGQGPTVNALVNSSHPGIYWIRIFVRKVITVKKDLRSLFNQRSAEFKMFVCFSVTFIEQGFSIYFYPRIYFVWYNTFHTPRL